MRIAVLVVLAAVACAGEGVTVGSGAHVYDVDDRWAKLPPGVALGYTHAIAVDRAGNVHVFNESPHAVAVFAPDGRFVRSWGAELFPGAHGLTLVEEAGEEVLYLAVEAQHRVVKATLAGEILWSLGYPTEAQVYASAEPYRPTWVAVAPNGDFYVTDGYGAGYIHHYRQDRTWVRTFGGGGAEPGRFQTPHGVMIDARRDPAVLLVADRESHRIQVLGLDGTPVSVIPPAGAEPAEQLLRRPCSFAVDGDRLVVADLCGRVTLLGRDGALLAQLGAEVEIWTRGGWPNLPPQTWAAGEFIAPHGVAADAAGNIYVAEWTGPGRITRLLKRK
ncbi:MAG TPA: hypothetical protein VEL07_04595 [Planctomycetota bacterium]|nr:hypothetical protein [Planctomycetota bacterium]